MKANMPWTVRPLTRYKNLEDTPNPGSVLALFNLVQAHQHLSNTLHLLAKDMEEVIGVLCLALLQKPELIVNE